MLGELLTLLENMTISLGVTIIATIVVLYLLKKMVPRIFPEETGIKLYRALKRPLLISFILIGLLLLLQKITMVKPYIAYVVTSFLITWSVLGGYIAIKIAEAIIETFHLKLRIPKSSIEVMKKLIKWLILLITILVILHVMNILRNVIAITMLIIGTLVFLAFAGWSIMGNITAGIVIMIWKPFKIGDKIEIIPENIVGTVEDITLMFTKIKTEQGHDVYIPNTMLMQKVIRNIH